MKITVILRNVVVLLLAVLVGATVNMGLVKLGPKLIAPPPGVDLTTEEGLKAGMILMEPKHFLFPFLAHALGTLVAVFLAVKFSAGNRRFQPWIIAGLFFIGGYMMVQMLPSPMWFNVLDLVGAYFPMAWAGMKLASSKANA